MKSADFDVVIIGSGFGGSVAALRLTEKGGCSISKQAICA
jgi:cholesterol oxidase